MPTQTDAGASRPNTKRQRRKQDPNTPSAAYCSCTNESFQDWPANSINPLVRSPEKRSSVYNVVVLMYERLPRVALKKDYAVELETESTKAYHDVSKRRWQ